MAFDFARHHDDPGLPPLHPERLAAGGAIDVQGRRRHPGPERVMRYVTAGFWVLFWMIFLAAATLGVLA
jgi:hypothetical protein